MKRTTLAIAIGAALAVQGAYAQKGGGDKGGREGPEPDSVVTVYGKIYPEILWVTSSGATAAGTPTCTICGAAEGENAIVKRNEMESSNSRLGFRGYERLGGTLKAIWQLETQFLVDDRSTPWAGRDSYVGLSDRWGIVKLGRFDTPFKEYGDDLSFLGVSSGNFTSTSGIYRHIGFGTQQNSARFHERRNNSVQYESPDFKLGDFKVMYSTDEAKTATRDPHVISMGGKLEFGRIEFLVGHEIHYDLFGFSRNAPSSMRNNNDQSVNSKDQATAVAVKFKFGNTQIELDANQKKYVETGTNVTGRVREYKNKAYMFVMDNRWGAWRTAFHYVKATAGSCTRVNAECTTDGLDGEQISIGASYSFSRRTWLFVMGSQVKNDKSAVYNNSNLQEPNVGEDIKQFAIGIHTSF